MYEGITEETAKEKGVEYGVGTLPLFANGKALIANGGVGAVKILYGKKFNGILGVHILGPRATDMIGEAALTIGLEATVEENIRTIHAHPTVTKAVREAALAAEKSNPYSEQINRNFPTIRSIYKFESPKSKALLTPRSGV